MSTDIEAGARWNRRVEEELGSTNFGIICVTPENQTAPWLLFEAGALAKSVDDARVVPYLIGLTAPELQAGPLTQFQAKSPNRVDTLAIVRTLNTAMKDALPIDKLDRAFDRWWPDLDAAIAAVPAPGPAPLRRPVEDMLEELLVAVRDLKWQTAEDEWEPMVSGGSIRSRTHQIFYPGHPERMSAYSIRNTDSNAALVEAVVQGLFDRLSQPVPRAVEDYSIDR